MTDRLLCLYPDDHLYLYPDENAFDTWASREVEIQEWMADVIPKYEKDHWVLGSEQEGFTVLEQEVNPGKIYWAMLSKVYITR